MLKKIEKKLLIKNFLFKYNIWINKKNIYLVYNRFNLLLINDYDLNINILIIFLKKNILESGLLKKINLVKNEKFI